jgi:undecaprenol kinase
MMLRKLFHSFIHAARGLHLAFRTQQNLRIHLLTFVLVLIGGFICTLNLVEWMLILGCSCLVLTAELLNTAIEELCNKLHPEKDSQIGKVKDIAAAAVLVTAIFAFIIGLLIFGNKLISQQ